MSKTNRNVVERWYLTGTLELTSPTSLSNGDDDPLVDLPIVVDTLDGVALLTGASLAGALRAYVAEFDPEYATALFGGDRGKPEGTQSALIVEDARGDKPVMEFRDGVSIEPTTRTAKERERYDRQLLAVGTTFTLGFELIVGNDPAAKPKEKEKRDKEIVAIKEALAVALRGLQQGDIRLGGRKRRGYGQCQVTDWQAWRYDLSTPKGMCGWLAHGRKGWPGYQAAQWTWQGQKEEKGILGWSMLPDVSKAVRRSAPFKLSATFDIDGAVLIRHGFEAETGPDAMHLRSLRPGIKDGVPVMSGTSLAGVMRAQALRIARTMAGEAGQGRAEKLVRGMFGYMQRPEELPKPADGSSPDRRQLKKHASRVTVDESVIEGQRDLVQTRVKIDRFTGGAFESALFAEQPAFGGAFTLNVTLRPPTPALLGLETKGPTEAQIEEKVWPYREAEIGLLLLVLKDLWTGFLPVGGSSSVGRGRLKGKTATIEYGDQSWTLEADGAEKVKLSPDAAKALNGYVAAFTAHVTGGQDGRK